MPTCDICGKLLNHSEMIEIDAKPIIEATSNGYIPLRYPSTFRVLGTQEKEELFSDPEAWDRLDSKQHLMEVRTEHWHMIVDKYAQKDWGLCQECLHDVVQFIPQDKSKPSNAPSKRWWQFWKKGNVRLASNGHVQSDEVSIRHSNPRSYSNKKKKCVNCGSDLSSGQLQCPSCGSERFIWE